MSAPAMMAVAFGGATLGAVGAYQSASAQEQAAKYNAGVAREQAGLARTQAEIDAETVARDSRKHLGEVRAAYGASGFSLDGSAFDVLEQEARTGALKEALVRYRGELTARGLEQQATMQDAAAKSYGSSKWIGALSSFASGASRAYAGAA